MPIRRIIMPIKRITTKGTTTRKPTTLRATTRRTQTTSKRTVTTKTGKTQTKPKQTKKTAAPKRTTGRKPTTLRATTKRTQTTNEKGTRKQRESGGETENNQTTYEEMIEIKPTRLEEIIKLEKEVKRKNEEKKYWAIEEDLKFKLEKIGEEEKKAKQKMRNTFLEFKAEEEAVKRHKLMILLRGSPEFRAEFWGTPKEKLQLMHKSDPVKNTWDTWSKQWKKVSSAEKERITANAARASKEWENGSLLRKYESTFQSLMNRHDYFTDKMNYSSLFQEVGKPFARFCEVTGLKRRGLLLDPSEFIRLPLREYMQDLAKMKYLNIAKAMDVLKTQKKSLEKTKKDLAEIERKKAAYFEELSRRAA